jgi:4-aminobutyrate aminotransferase
MKPLPSESESDTNLSPQPRAWAEKNLDPEAQTLLAEDEKYFLRQSVSTPCLNAVVKAGGIWIEDTAGRRSMATSSAGGGKGRSRKGLRHRRLASAGSSTS